MLIGATNQVLQFLLAPTCAACGAGLEQPLGAPVCSTCWRLVPRLDGPTCARCGDGLAGARALVTAIDGQETNGGLCRRCRRSPRHFTVARSAGLYAGSLRALIQAFKYRRHRALAAPLATLLREAGADLFEDAEAVVPVPLHPWRSLVRGFNQADDLACQLSLPVWRVIRRHRLERPQARSSGGQRRANVRQAFAIGRGVRRSTLANRTLVLIDDVMTTGETIEACSAVLVAAGVREVRAVTVARTVAGSPPPRRLPRPPETVRHR